MQGHKDNEFVSDKNSKFELSIFTVIGDREDQQDSFGYELKNEEGIVVLCDGVGGCSGGKIASSSAVDEYLTEYNKAYPVTKAVEFLNETTQKANRRVVSLTDGDGKSMNAGSTIVTVLIRGNELFWNSVGDSRAYLLRNGEFVQFTVDHNYKTVLLEKKNAGLISDEVFEKENERAEALISFLGIGELRLVDYNDSPFLLMKDDKIIIMSDGLYKLVSDDEMVRILDNFSNIDDALQALELKAKKRGRKVKRDNMTVALIKIL